MIYLSICRGEVVEFLGFMLIISVFLCLVGGGMFRVYTVQRTLFTVNSVQRTLCTVNSVYIYRMMYIYVCVSYIKSIIKSI